MCNLETLEQFVISFRPGGFLFLLFLVHAFVGRLDVLALILFVVLYSFRQDKGNPTKQCLLKF